MADKSSDWQPGPNVCRCCFAEGCYKDISTEYFWMGKKEVYSDMLLDTFDISIGYSKTQGPNSNSRLICEPCISRLRDATDFKRQVQECERTFMQHLDPGRSSTVEVPLEQHKGEIKLERVKIEEEKSDDDFDAPFDEPFGDDDDDDLDDQPLTKLATKIPKKESEDLLRNLLVKAEKRKAPLKVKVVPAKKVKKKDEPQPTASKAKPVEKKKKGDDKSPSKQYDQKKKMDRITRILQSSIILGNTKICPFEFQRVLYKCVYCSKQFTTMEDLRAHNEQHGDLDAFKIRRAITSPSRDKIKVDVTNTECKICGDVALNMDALIKHLVQTHNKDTALLKFDGFLPFKVNGQDHNCVLCDAKFDTFKALNQHINVHYRNFVCEVCGAGFVTKNRLTPHLKSHDQRNIACETCKKVCKNKHALDDHIKVSHSKTFRYKCPHCTETFRYCQQKNQHFAAVHNIKAAEYKCAICVRVFFSSSQRLRHVNRIHKKMKRFTCDLCEYQCFDKKDLEDHMSVHFDLKSFKCQFCAKSFNRKVTLREHTRIHLNDRRFVCAHCSMAFIQKCSLKSHVKSRHPEMDVKNL